MSRKFTRRMKHPRRVRLNSTLVQSILKDCYGPPKFEDDWKKWLWMSENPEEVAAYLSFVSPAIFAPFESLALMMYGNRRF